jgi:hypothetical protein
LLSLSFKVFLIYPTWKLILLFVALLAHVITVNVITAETAINAPTVDYLGKFGTCAVNQEAMPILKG